MLSKQSILSLFALLTSILIITGCGGGGGSTSSSTNTPPVPPSSQVTKFHVDVHSGEVSIVAPESKSGTLSSNAIFTGSSIKFNSSKLLDQSGNNGLKVLSVSLTNQWGLAIGKAPNGEVTGCKVLFSPFTNVTTFSDLRPKTLVSTIAGNGAIGSTDGSAANATFNGPSGVAADNEGNIYVTDLFANNIRKISNGYVSTLAGGGTSGVNGTGAVAGFNNPYGIAYNSIDGSLVVTEVSGNRVRRVTPDGQVTTIAGTGSAGAVNGTGDVASLNGPAGVVVDSIGNIYVAEINGNRIRKIVRTGSDPTLAASYTVSTFAGSGAAGNQDGTGTSAAFKSPAGLAIDPGNVIYAVDQSNNKIRRIDRSGNVSTIAGTGMGTSTDGLGTIATFNKPRGIVYVNNALVVTEELGNRIRQISLIGGSSTAPNNPANWQVATLAGTGAAGGGNGLGSVAAFNSPELICADRTGNILVADLKNYAIRKVVPNSGSFPIGITTGSTSTDTVQLSNADGYIPNQSSGANLPYINYPFVINSGETCTALQWQFVIPTGVTAFEFNVIVETSTETITPPESDTGKGSSNVIVSTYAGKSGVKGFVDGDASYARFNDSIAGIAADRYGNVYVSDLANHSIRRISVTGVVSTIAGTVLTGGGSLVDGTGNVAKFSAPSSIAVTNDGAVIYVADTNNHRIRRISLTGYNSTKPDSWYVATIAGTSGASLVDGSGSTATMSSPVGIAVDNAGTVYFSETGGNRIRRMQLISGNPNDASNWMVTTLAGDNTKLFGSTGFVNGTGTNARFSNPQGIACDSVGNVYVADSDNYVIRKVTPDGVVSTLAGSTSGYDDSSGTKAKFLYPSNICIDNSNYLYVTDGLSSSSIIRRISPAGLVTTVAGGGINGHVDGTGNAVSFTNAFSVTTDSNSNLYIGEADCVRKIQRVITDGR